MYKISEFYHKESQRCENSWKLDMSLQMSKIMSDDCISGVEFKLRNKTMITALAVKLYILIYD